MPLVPVYNNLLFLKALSDVENQSKVGYSYDTNQWVPHASIEGGTETIGYGHKLTKAESVGKYVVVGKRRVPFDINKGVGLTDEEVHELFSTDVRNSYATALKEWNQHAKGTDPLFSSLPHKYQGILLDIVFNVGTLATNGTWDWPKLKAAIIDNNDSLVRKESLRYFFDTFGRKRPLTRRTNIIANSLGLGF